MRVDGQEFGARLSVHGKDRATECMRLCQNKLMALFTSNRNIESDPLVSFCSTRYGRINSFNES